jgi:hypothetical protein
MGSVKTKLPKLTGDEIRYLINSWKETQPSADEWDYALKEFIDKMYEMKGVGLKELYKLVNKRIGIIKKRLPYILMLKIGVVNEEWLITLRNELRTLVEEFQSTCSTCNRQHPEIMQ